MDYYSCDNEEQSYLNGERYYRGSSEPHAKPKGAKARGNAKAAARLRISEAMTVSQLQQECKFRGIRGFSAKTKDRLLLELGVGSFWQSHGKEDPKKQVKSVDSYSNMKRIVPNVAPGTGGVLPPPYRPKPKSLLKKKSPSPEMAFINFPRVDSTMTVPQLSYELMCRQPHIKGSSSKPKSWFLSMLGVNSIWSTNPAFVNKLASAPRISKKMTVSQLVNEVTARAPAIQSLGRKSKDELIQLLGDGSIWTTAHVALDHYTSW